VLLSIQAKQQSAILMLLLLLLLLLRESAHPLPHKQPSPFKVK
jgi:hypothetical protein